MSSQAREPGLRQDPHQGGYGTQPGAEVDGVVEEGDKGGWRWARPWKASNGKGHG